MKKVYLFLVFAIFNIAMVSGQSKVPEKLNTFPIGIPIGDIDVIKQDPSCQNYQQPSGWGYIYNYVTACPGYTALTSGLAPNINILSGTSGFDTTCSNVNSGYVLFNNVAGAHENRRVKSLGTAYDKNFQMSFNLNVANSQTGNAFFPVLLSSDNAEPNIGTSPCVLTTMDELIVSVDTPSPSSAASPRLKVIVRDSGVNIANMVLFNLTYGTNYYCTIKVYGNENAEILIYSNCNKTNLLYKQCFNFPKTVNGLTFLQHSINSYGGYTRRSSGRVADVCIKKVEYDCCKMSISGRNVICEATSTGPSETYTISAGNDVSGQVITVSPGVSYLTNTNGSITITNWGTFTTAPKIVTITARAICQCKEISETLTVYVHPKLNPVFNFSGLGNTGLNLNNFTLTPVAIPMTGVVHQWEIFNSDAMGSQLGIVRGAFWNTGAPITINSALPTQLLSGTFYMVKHGMYFNNGLCSWTEKRGLIYVYASSRMMYVEEDKNGKFEKNEVMQQVKAYERKVKLEEKEGVQIAPNPVQDVLNINTNKTILSMYIYNSLGQMILEVEKPETTRSINVNEFAAGNYFLKINTEIGTESLKFIKR